MLRSLSRLLLVALAIFSGLGCEPRPGTPTETLSAYRAALAGGRLDEAYSLMSARYRAHHDRAAFAHALPPLGAGAPLTPARVTAEVILPGQGAPPIPLVWEAGAWHLEGSGPSVASATTPEQALRAFVRAADEHRYRDLLAFIPARARATTTEASLRARFEGPLAPELAADLARVRAHLDDPFEVSGDDARLPLGDRLATRLHREAGLWKIERLK